MNPAPVFRGFPTLLVAALIFQFAAPLAGQQADAAAKSYPFPIYKNKPSGRQVSGQHAPASTPALSPEEAQKRFAVPPGFEVRLFAAEPEVVNPVAMTWDERGRLWVVELYEYPLGAKPGEKPRDRIKIFEDTDADGRSDKITVFADGLNLATGILLGNGGAYVGQAPELLFLKDTDGDDVADQRTTLMTGFGLEDRHELLNGFIWGPDGWLYMTHGVFTHSKVKNPDNPNDDGVVMNAAVARWHPRTKKFEVFADGTSNPWGVDFDRAGNAFVSACVIDHLFHMAPGGQYNRQGGVWANPYGYVDMLPSRGLTSIVDHRHHMAAYAGAQIYQGNQYPAEYLGTILIGNIHDNAVHQDRLTPNGSSFKASFVKDFVRANDGWFRPVSTQCGPDGAIWLMDWYDKYPCYQNANADPEGVDREHGRIWRVVFVGEQKDKPMPSRPEVAMNLAQLGTAELVNTLAHSNVWHRRMAQRLLQEKRDATAKPLLEQLLATGKTAEARLAAFWTLHASDQLEEAILDRYSTDREPMIRTWVARFTGERRAVAEGVRDRLIALASDSDPSVRFAVAVAARQFTSGSLTVNTPLPSGVPQVNNGAIVAALIQSSSDAKDPLLPFMIWMASEPGFARNPEAALRWLAENGPSRMPLAGQLAQKAMRRICDMNQPEQLDKAVQFIVAAAEADPNLASAAIDGLLEGQKGKPLVPTQPTAPVLAKLNSSSNAQLKERAQRLGTLWGDSAAILQTVNLVRDTSAALPDRQKAVQSLRQLKNDVARDSLVALIGTSAPDALQTDAILALGEIGGDAVADTVIKSWKRLPAGARRAAADSLASRRNWARAFLTAVEQKTISASDIPASSIRALVNHRDDYIRNNAARAIGRFREADADKLKLIADKRKVVLAGEADLNAGREVARKTCLTCHKFHGEGTDIGPDLTGVGRSTLDALLHNVIHPNEIIGKGYENVEVETKDGRIVSGRVVEDNESRVKLLAVGPKEEVVARSDIGSLRVTEMSVMPEGLEQMPDADFRNLIWFILNPPEDKQPLTPERRRELVGDERSAAVRAPVDRESVALWNPSWRVLSGEIDDAPAKLVEYKGRKNVLMTHPLDRDKPAALTRSLAIPANSKAELTLAVAAHDQGDWELRVVVKEETLKAQVIDREGDSWKRVRLDLSRFAGTTVELRLENRANGWEWEFGYWAEAEVRVRPADTAQADVAK